MNVIPGLVVLAIAVGQRMCEIVSEATMLRNEPEIFANASGVTSTTLCFRMLRGIE
jgi:hypothetical protein